MAIERQKITVPADNYGRVYIGLLESKLSAYAKFCYGAMWSFGQESWASVPSIARRMSVSENTVRKAQQELQAAGWIVEAPNTKGNGLTRLWTMVPPAMLEAVPEPLQEVNQGVHVVKGVGSPGEGVGVHVVNPNKEGKQEGKKDIKQVPSGKHPDQDIFWTKAKESWKAHTKGQDLEWPKTKTFQATLTSKIEKHGATRLAEFFQNHLDAPFGKKSLLTFFFDVDAWTVAQPKKGGNPARPFHSPAPVDAARPATVLGDDHAA